MVLRFPHVFNAFPCAACGATHQRDERLLERLTSPDELCGLLNRTLAAYLKLLERGAFTETASTQAGAAELDEAIDDTHSFIEECCVQGEGIRAYRTTLFRAYKQWCLASGHRPIRDRLFYQRIRARGFEGHLYSGRVYFHGLGLRSEAP